MDEHTPRPATPDPAVPDPTAARRAPTSTDGSTDTATPLATPDGPDPAAEAAWAERPLDPRDYSRRTLLANERTYLAWWRTGLTALAAALAAARVVPELADAHDRWPYTLLGVGCVLVGLLAIGYGHRRRIEIEQAVLRGSFPPVSSLVTRTMSALGVLIGLGMLLIIVFET